MWYLRLAAGGSYRCELVGGYRGRSIVVVAAGVEYEDEKQSDIVASGVNCLSLV